MPAPVVTVVTSRHAEQCTEILAMNIMMLTQILLLKLLHAKAETQVSGDQGVVSMLPAHTEWTEARAVVHDLGRKLARLD